PDVMFQFLPRHNAVRVQQQLLQQLALDRVQLQQLATASCFQRVGIILEVGNAQAAPSSLGTLNQGLQAGFEFFLRRRFDQVVVSAGTKSFQFVVEVVARGQHQYRGTVVGFAAQASAQGQAIDAGQVEVQHDGVEVARDREVQAAQAIGC